MSRTFLVPDLSPEARLRLSKLRPRFVFVAESPHVNEIEPAQIEDRRPLCGKAGKEWWKMIGELLEQESSEDTTLFRLLRMCEAHSIAVMNAVQYPLDVGVVKKFPEADPMKILGFNKGTGPTSYKKAVQSPALLKSLKSLRERLQHPSVASAPIYALGMDAEWFIRHTLSERELNLRYRGRIPHPSAWWRRGGFFREQARAELKKLFSNASHTEQ